MAKAQTPISNPREELIKRGLIKPGTAPETVKCQRCSTPFDRIKGRNWDTLCGRRDCRTPQPTKVVGK